MRPIPPTSFQNLGGGGGGGSLGGGGSSRGSGGGGFLPVVGGGGLARCHGGVRRGVRRGGGVRVNVKVRVRFTELVEPVLVL